MKKKSYNIKFETKENKEKQQLLKTYWKIYLNMKYVKMFYYC